MRNRVMPNLYINLIIMWSELQKSSMRRRIKTFEQFSEVANIHFVVDEYNNYVFDIETKVIQSNLALPNRHISSSQTKPEMPILYHKTNFKVTKIIPHDSRYRITRLSCGDKRRSKLNTTLRKLLSNIINLHNTCLTNRCNIDTTKRDYSNNFTTLIQQSTSTITWPSISTNCE